MTSHNTPITKKSSVRLHSSTVTDFVQVSGFEGTATLHISDLNCTPMLKKQITPDEQIAVYGLKKGVYIAKISTATETVERKLVKG